MNRYVSDHRLVTEDALKVVEAQRDALLEALKKIRTKVAYAGRPGDGWLQDIGQTAQDAIAACEE